MSINQIEKLEDVFLLDKTKTITGHKLKKLTSAGENYGSLMLSVDITVKTPERTEKIHAVAKMVPPNDFIQQIFNTQVSFRNEIAFYKNIVPTLQNFQREHGIDNVIDFSPKYYGSRINLSGDPDKVDSNAVLLLENLKEANFINFERTKGFDLEAAKLIISDLAQFHAVPLALKLQKPEVFENEVKRYLYKRPVKNSEVLLRLLLDLVEQIDECKPYKSRVEQAVKLRFQEKPPSEPFSTISHNDVWVNNTMQKTEGTKVVQNKLVDFQVCEYASPAKDLLFFLFTSVQNEVLKEHCDGLIRFYHEEFTRILQELKCDIGAFSFEAFGREVKEATHTEFAHVLFMLTPIFARKEKAVELEDITIDFFKNANAVASDLHKEKAALVIQEFAKRNWI